MTIAFSAVEKKKVSGRLLANPEQLKSHLAGVRDRLERHVNELSLVKLREGSTAMIVDEILKRDVYEHAAVRYDDAVVDASRNDGRDYVHYKAPCTETVSWAGGGYSDHWRGGGDDAPYNYYVHRSYEVIGENLPSRSTWQVDMESNVSEVNRQIDDHYEKLESQLNRQVSERKRLADAITEQAISDNLRVPRLTRFIEQLAPKLTMISIAEADRRVASGVPISKVTIDIRNSIVDGIRKFGTALEEATPALPAIMIGQGEEQMRELLLVGLRMQYGGAVTAESYVRQGKTDILVRWHDTSIFIAELKIYRRPSDVEKAITQLFGYIPVRNNHAALVWFIKGTKNSEQSEVNIKKGLKAHGLYVGPVTGKNDEYEFRHASDSARKIRLALVVIIIDDVVSPLEGL